MGIRVSETARAASREKETVSAWSRKSWAATPSRKTTGRKTATVVRVEAMTAWPTSEAPLRAAVVSSSPASRRLTMASRTTMAESTSIPTPRASPPRDMMLRVVPVRYIRKKVATTEIGMEMRDDEGGAEVLEEEQQDQDRHDAADEGVGEDLADRGLDEAALVGAGGDLDVLGELLGDGVEPGADRARHAHGVGVALFVDRQLHRLDAVEAGDDLALPVGADDLGHIADGDVAAVLAQQHGLADVVEIAELVAGAHQVAGLGLIEAAAGLVEVLGEEPGVDLVDREAEQGEPALVDADLDLFLVAAVDLDGGDALGGLEVLLDELLGDIAQLVEAVAARTGRAG